jgi:CDP-6-deoxy-D-xylo-4-hexulose-3-dehydrase
MSEYRRIQVGDFRIGEEEKTAIEEVLNSGKITENKKVHEFEREFANFVGTKYCVAVNSGTSALISGLTALKYHKKRGIKSGANVITTPLTYIATSNAIVLSGFDPVYVDVDPVTFGITPENIEEHLERTDNLDGYSAILPVHLMGYACDMDKINRIARDYGLQVFEDSAQALGTTYKGKKTGTLSLLSDYSFYIAHNVQAGEMGAVVTDDLELWKLVKKIKANGRMCDCPICVRSEGRCPKIFKSDIDADPRFTHELIGYNFKTMEFQAALTLIQLKKVDFIIKKRRENVKYLNEGLEEFSDILQLPVYSDNVSYLAYPMIIKKSNMISRRKLREKLEKIGIETRPLFGCIPTQQPAYAHLKESYKGKLPNAERIGLNGFYIGCHQYLTEDDLDYVIKGFKEILGPSL